jgi:uncharacterized membrane protein YdjX (TVP38/TMEM64 family)
MDNSRRIIALSVLLTGISAAIFWRDYLSVDALIDQVGQLGWIAPLVFIACYAVSAVFLMPGLLFTLAGGVLFGPAYGTLYNLVGATIGATLAFLTARYIAYDWVTKRTGNRLRQLVAGVEKEGWRFVALTRLVPIFPFNLLNYAFGLTNIRLSHYIITSFIFMAPSGAAYTYLGYAGREVAAGGEDVIKKVLLAIAVIAAIAFASRVWLRRRRNKVDVQ